MKLSLKFILIRIILSLLVAFSFWFVDTYLVHAMSNINSLSNLTISEQGRFYNNLASSSSSIGYDISKVGDGELAYYTAYPTGSTSYNYGGYGGSIVQCDMSFVANNYYSVSYYWLSDSGAYYFHPYYTQLTNKLAIGNNISISRPNFTYETISTDIQSKLIEGLGYLTSYTVIFKAPNSGTCLLSAFSSNPTSPSDGQMFVGYKYESMGAKAPSTTDIQNALSSSFNSINNNINNHFSSVNSNIDELKQKQNEQNETSKGIWGSLKDGISSIGDWFKNLGKSISDLASSIGQWFKDLFKDIKSLFVGEDVCVESDTINYFRGYDSPDIHPNSDGWITLDVSTTGSYKELFYYSDKLDNLPEKKYNIFLEIKDFTYTGNGGYFAPVYSVSSKRAQVGSAFTFEHGVLSPDVIQYDSTHVKTKNNVYNWQEDYKVSSSDTYFNVLTAMARSGGASIHVTFRVVITDDLSITLDNYEYFTVKKECHKEGGLFAKLSDGLSKIGEFFSNLIKAIGLYIETLWNNTKSLFVGEEKTTCKTETNYMKPLTWEVLCNSVSGAENGSARSTVLTVDENYYYSLKGAMLWSYYTDKLDVKPNKTYRLFIDVKDGVFEGSNFHYKFNWGSYGQFIEDNKSVTVYNGSLPNIYYIDLKTKSDFSDVKYGLGVSYQADRVGSNVRFFLTDDLDKTIDDYSYFNGTKEDCTSTREGGLFNMINNLISSISNFFSRLFALFEDTDVSGSTSDGQSFFEGFEDKDYGLSDVISMPLVYIGKISTTTCTPLVVPLPFVEQDVVLPCMGEVYKEHFGSFLTIYQTITFGIIAYWICINTFAMVKGFKNPDDDRIEVMEL